MQFFASYCEKLLDIIELHRQALLDPKEAADAIFLDERLWDRADEIREELHS